MARGVDRNLIRLAVVGSAALYLGELRRELAAGFRRPYQLGGWLVTPTIAAEIATEGIRRFDSAGEELAKLDMPRELPMRHRTPQFQHVFASDGYSAGYYSYLWSEVLDADAFAAFEETGNVFDHATAERLAQFVYSAGGVRPEDEAYQAFRGRAPKVEGLLKKRGLVG